MKKPVKVLLIVSTVIILLFASGIALISSSEKKLNAIAEMMIEDVDMSAVSDGTYKGEYHVFPISAKVLITVKDHTIIKIDLIKHITGQGGAADAIPGKVVEAQSLRVDAVSGATYSSKVILLAIRDALTSPPSAE